MLSTKKLLSSVLVLIMMLYILTPALQLTGTASASDSEKSRFYSMLRGTAISNETVDAAISSGDWSEADAELLDFYKNKFADIPYITYNTASTSAQYTAKNNVLAYNESYIKSKTINESADFASYEIGGLSASQTRSSYKLMVYQSSDNVIVIDKSSIRLVVTCKNGNVITYPVQKATYIRYGSAYETADNSEETALLTGHKADNGKKWPYTDRDARIYIDFGSVNTADISSSKLVFNAKTAAWSDTSAKGSSALNIVVMSHTLGAWNDYGTLTWKAAADQNKIGTVSWDGIDEGIIWDEDLYGTEYIKLGVADEFLNYNTRFIQISSLCQTGHYTDAKNMLLNFAEQTFSVISDGTGMPKSGRAIEPANRALEFPYIYRSLLINNTLTPEENYKLLHWYYQDIEFISQEKTGVVYKSGTAAEIGSNSTAYFTNWGIWHLTGFYNCINFFDEFSNSAEWKRNFNARLSKTADGIVFDDGSYREVTFGYAVDVLEWITGMLNYIGQSGKGSYQPGAAEVMKIENRLVDLVHYLLMCTYPNGILPDYGDYSANKEFMYAAGLLTSIEGLAENIDTVRRAKLDEILWYQTGGKTGSKPAASKIYDDSLLAVDRTDRLADTNDTLNSMLFFNAKAGGGHAHRDALSIMFYAKGRELLTDRGTITYDKNAAENELRTKTWVANTVSVKKDGSIYSQKTSVNQKSAGSSMTGASDSIAATYRGVTDTYNNIVKTGTNEVLIDITHKRNVTYLKEYDLLLVNDIMEPSDPSVTHTFSQNWHPLNGAAPTVNSAGSAPNDNVRGKTNFADGSDLYIAQANSSYGGKITGTVRQTYDSKNPNNKTAYMDFSVTKSGNASFNTALLAYDSESENNKVRLIRTQFTDEDGNNYNDNKASITRIQLIKNGTFNDEIVYLNTFADNFITKGVKCGVDHPFKFYSDAKNSYFRIKNSTSSAYKVNQLYLSDGTSTRITENGKIIAYITASQPVTDIAATWDRDTNKIYISTSDSGVISGTTKVEISFYPDDTPTIRSIEFNGTSLNNKNGCTVYDTGKVIIPQIEKCEAEHKFGDRKTVTPATCTTAGLQERICVYCPAKDTMPVPAEGHSYGMGTVKIQPTCTDKGLETAICSKCGAEKDTVINATGIHTDNDGDKFCDVCGKDLSQKQSQSFFDKIISFFKRIADWFRNLFR